MAGELQRVPETSGNLEILKHAITINQIIGRFLEASVVIDHGALSGLTDDDHTQYYNTARLTAVLADYALTTDLASYYTIVAADATFAPISHTHDDRYFTETESDARFAPLSHTHTASQVTDFSEAVDDRVSNLLVAGSNITLTYNDGANTLTIDAAGGSGAVATDTIWDAAGDLAVGTGSNTAARLAIGSTGDVLTVSGGTAVWSAPSGAFNPRNTYYLYDDLDYPYNLTSGSSFWIGYQSSGTLSVIEVAGRPGVVRLASGTAASGRCSVGRSYGALSAGVRPLFPLAGGGVLTYKVGFRVPSDISTSAAQCYMQMGFGDEITGWPSHGLYLQVQNDGATGTQIQGVARSSSSDTNSGSPATVTANTWYEASIVVAADGSSVEFFLGATSLGTISTGLPTGQGMIYALWNNKSGGNATSYTLDVDYIECTQTFTSARA